MNSNHSLTDNDYNRLPFHLVAAHSQATQQGCRKLRVPEVQTRAGCLQVGQA